MIPKKHNAVFHLRAFIAYAESSRPGLCFTLIPYDQAIAAGIPFSETFIHEELIWAVWIGGFFSKEELIALEQAGVIDSDLNKGTGSAAQDKANADWNKKCRKENGRK